MPESLPARAPVGARSGTAYMLLGLALMGIAAAQPGPGADSAQATLARVIGDVACNSDADCRTSAVGRSACGGPERYVAWSVLRTDVKALQRAIEGVEAQRSAVGVPGGRMSTCEWIADPGAVCVKPAGPSVSGDVGGQGRCALRPKNVIRSAPAR